MPDLFVPDLARIIRRGSSLDAPIQLDCDVAGPDAA